MNLAPMSLRSSCSGSAAHDKKVHTSLAICDSVAGVPSSYSTPPSTSILGMAMAPPGKYGL